MKTLLKTIKPYLIWLIPIFGILLLLYLFFDKIKLAIASLYKKRENDSYSDNKNVDRVIKIIDDSLDRFGTLNSHHDIIFDNILDLSREDLLKLHKDFGFRHYVRGLGYYEVYENIPSPILPVKLDLAGLFRNEFDKVQMSRLKTMYEMKAIRGVI